MVGECLRGDGRYAEALERYLEMCDVAGDETSGMTPGIAAWARPNSLAFAGVCLELLDRRGEAIIKFTEAANLFEQFPLSGSQARCLERLADVLAGEGRADESRQVYAHAAGGVRGDR